MMSVPFLSIALFILNFLDGVLTVYWVRNGFATEANQLMASLLDLGNTPFLTVKIFIGAITAFVLWYGGKRKLARYGLGISLIVYSGIMAIHFLTGLSACGLISDAMLHRLTDLSQFFAFVI